MRISAACVGVSDMQQRRVRSNPQPLQQEPLIRDMLIFRGEYVFKKKLDVTRVQKSATYGRLPPTAYPRRGRSRTALSARQRSTRHARGAWDGGVPEAGADMLCCGKLYPGQAAMFEMHAQVTLGLRHVQRPIARLTARIPGCRTRGRQVSCNRAGILHRSAWIRARGAQGDNLSGPLETPIGARQLDKVLHWTTRSAPGWQQRSRGWSAASSPAPAATGRPPPAPCARP